MYHSFLIHSSADGHLGCFHVLAMINSAAMNIGVHMSLSDLASFVCMPRSGIAGSYGSSISSFAFSFHHMSFAKLDFCCAWSPPSWGRAEVVLGRLNLSHGTRYVGGVCNFLGSVLPQQRFEMADQCYSSVTAQSFIQQAKESTPSRHEDRPTWKERPQSGLASSFYMFCLLPPISCPMQVGLAKKGRMCFTWTSHSEKRGFYFVPFLWAFLFLYILAIAILDSFFLF